MSPASLPMGTAARVAYAFTRNTSSEPLKDFLGDLDSLRTEIASASRDTVADPHSECRKAMKLLANLAAYHGPMGDAAREELCDLYQNPPQGMSSEVRDQLLNSALEVCMSSKGELQELEATVLVMAGFAPESPVGENGEGPRTLVNQALLQKLGDEYGPEPLAKDRVVTSSELIAGGAQLKNLNWSEPASMATPEAARQSFDRVLSEVAIQQKTLTIWVADAQGQCVPVVAQPTPSGGIRFHVIAQAESGNQVGKHLAELSGDDCVIVHQVEDTHIALKHLDANSHDERGAGGVLREHTENWSSMRAADQEAAKLVSKAGMFQAVSEAGPRFAAQLPMPEIVAQLPVNLARAQEPVAPELEPNPGAAASAVAVEGPQVDPKLRELSKSLNMRMESGALVCHFNDVTKGFNEFDRMGDESLSADARMKASVLHGLAQARLSPEAQAYKHHVTTLTAEFKSCRQSLLMSTNLPSGHPLTEARAALMNVGGEAAGFQHAQRTQMLLAECRTTAVKVDASKEDSVEKARQAIRNTMGELERMRETTVKNIDQAIDRLNKVTEGPGVLARMGRSLLRRDDITVGPEVVKEAARLSAALQAFRRQITAGTFMLSVQDFATHAKAFPDQTLALFKEL